MDHNQFFSSVSKHVIRKRDFIDLFDTTPDKKLRKRDPELDSYRGTNRHLVEMIAADAKKRELKKLLKKEGIANQPVTDPFRLQLHQSQRRLPRFSVSEKMVTQHGAIDHDHRLPSSIAANRPKHSARTLAETGAPPAASAASPAETTTSPPTTAI